MCPQFPVINNLVLLRLIFAFQVVFVHLGEYLNIRMPPIIHHFPGVPAFFFVSGFLVYTSYRHSPGIIYFQNRFLRVMPGLIAVTVGSLLIILMARGFHDLAENGREYFVWLLLQLSVGQAYNPAIFRDVGVGVINGSLWTITVELFFYLAVPLVVYYERKVKHLVLLLVVFSFVIYSFGPMLLGMTVYRDKSIYDLFSLTPFVWGWMFGIGVLCSKYYYIIRHYLKYLPVMLIPLVMMIIFGDGVVFGSSGNRIGIIYFICYASLVLWFAFNVRYIGLPFDISYGVYIWHMPVLNFLLIVSIEIFSVALIATLGIAILSWFLLERPALKLKRNSLQ